MATADRQRWAVVGGGPAGLLAARSLARAGRDVTLFEESDAVGGRLSRLEVAGVTVDAGAESFATRGGSVARLVEQLGLGPDIVAPSANPAWVVGPGRPYPLPATGWLGIPLDPMARDVRRALGWVGAWRAQRDLSEPLAPLADDVTIGQLARLRLGDAAVDRLVGPVISGVYSRPVDEIPLEAIAPGLVEQVREHGGLIATARSRRAAAPAGAAVNGIVGGMFRLADALADDAAAHGASIVTSAPVASVVARGAGWTVTVDGAGHDVDGVVVAVTRERAAALGLGGPVVSAGRVGVVVLALDEFALDGAPRGTGVLVAGGATRAKALTHSSVKWPWLVEVLPPGRHLVRLSYSLERPDEDVRSHALSDAAVLLGTPLGEAHLVGMAQRSWLDASPSRVEDTQPLPGLHLVGSAAGLTGLAAIAEAAEAADFA